MVSLGQSHQAPRPQRKMELPTCSCSFGHQCCTPRGLSSPHLQTVPIAPVPKAVPLLEMCCWGKLLGKRLLQVTAGQEGWQAGSSMLCGGHGVTAFGLLPHSPITPSFLVSGTLLWQTANENVPSVAFWQFLGHKPVQSVGLK